MLWRESGEDILPGWEAPPSLASPDLLSLRKNLVSLRSALSEHSLSPNNAQHLCHTSWLCLLWHPAEKALDQLIGSGNMGGLNKLRIKPETQIVLGGVNYPQWSTLIR